jgi:hypothetical protein
MATSCSGAVVIEKVLVPWPLEHLEYVARPAGAVHDIPRRC